MEKRYDLVDTVKLMISPDYKDRMKGEYLQVKIRHDKLDDMLKKNARGELDFNLSCPVSVLHKQLLVMEEYMHILEERAEIEGVYFWN